MRIKPIIILGLTIMLLSCGQNVNKSETRFVGSIDYYPSFKLPFPIAHNTQISHFPAEVDLGLISWEIVQKTRKRNADFIGLINIQLRRETN
jgi:hypothetical protein